MVRKFKPISTSATTPVENKKRKELLVKVPKKENILFIGSENFYNSFWLKMMFISAAHAMARDSSRFRQADKKTLAYVDSGYTRIEKLTLDYLQKELGFEIKKLASSSDLIACLNSDRQEYKLQDVVFFCHGEPGRIALNYWSSAEVDLDLGNFTQVSANAFLPNGRLFSFACRTGVYVSKNKFDSEAEAKPEESLAQKMANHFHIEVHAFLRRSYYGDVLREKSQSEVISSTLKAERESKEGNVIQIPPEHEALPHPGLDDSLNPWRGSKREGTVGYALWRKRGGRTLPTAAETPTGLPTEMRVFRPA